MVKQLSGANVALSEEGRVELTGTTDETHKAQLLLHAFILMKRITNTDVADNVGVNHSLHRPSALSTSVHTECLGEPNPSSSTSRRSLTQYKEQRSNARLTGTGVNVRRRNVVDRTHSNRVSVTHVSPPAGNNSQGSSTANNEGGSWQEFKALNYWVKRWRIFDSFNSYRTVSLPENWTECVISNKHWLVRRDPKGRGTNDIGGV
ncbi:hypothetical protein Tco_0517301 [Tanacetum coccineum]